MTLTMKSQSGVLVNYHTGFLRTCDDAADLTRWPQGHHHERNLNMTTAPHDPPIPARIHAASAGFMAFAIVLLYIVGFAWPTSILSGCGIAALYFASVIAGRAFARRR
jgi:hypothetical protein